MIWRRARYRERPRRATRLRLYLAPSSIFALNWPTDISCAATAMQAFDSSPAVD